MRPELTRASDLLRDQSPEAVAKAIGLLQEVVFSFSMKMCGHRQDAEDTSQEVLYRSLKHLPKLQNPSALAAWLYTVTRNRCHRLRGVAADSPMRKLSLEELMPDETELSQLLLDAKKSPEGRLLQKEKLQFLHKALLQIPSQLRLVLVLHDMEELETDLVAKILNLQVGTVRVRLHRARLALRKEIAQIIKARRAGASAAPQRRALSRKAGEGARRPKECRELFASLSEYLDGRVGSETCEQMSAHIAGCPACVAFLQDLREAIVRCKSMDAPCDQAVASRLQAMLTSEYLRLMGRASSSELTAGA